MHFLIRALAVASLAAAMTSSDGGCVVYWGSPHHHGLLWIQIVSPSPTGSYTSALSSVAIGGDVGGWSTWDPAPTIYWNNDKTGDDGSVGQWTGTFMTGQIALEPGPNPIHVRASNGVQASATATIVVTRVP
jgi:hypothetical protein